MESHPRTGDMFRGRFQHTIDPKGRLSVPAKFRDVLAQYEGALIIVPNENALEVHPLEEWERLETRINEQSQFDPEVRKLGRLYVSRAKDVALDGAGRILLPPDSRQQAGLAKEVTLAGTGTAILRGLGSQAIRRIRADERRRVCPRCSSGCRGWECRGSRPGPRRRGRVSVAARSGGMVDRRDGGDGGTRGSAAGDDRGPAFGCWRSTPTPTRWPARPAVWLASATGFGSCTPTSASWTGWRGPRAWRGRRGVLLDLGRVVGPARALGAGVFLPGR